VIGTMEEAQEIFKAPENRLPPGWDRLGTGGTRQVYRSPTGVVYKVCWDYEDDEPTPTTASTGTSIGFDGAAGCRRAGRCRTVTCISSRPT
jgi:hypothetical protein